MNLLLCILALALAYVSADSISWLADSRIVGGKPVNIEDYPYQVSILTKEKPEESIEPNCGGSIYSERIIITAAHCVVKHDASWIQVAAGSKYANGTGGIIVSVKETIIHEDHKSDIQENDIAIVILNTPLPLNNRTMKAISLVEKSPINGEIGTVSGWGRLKENGNFSDILQAVQLPIVSKEDCSKDLKVLEINITSAMLCAGYRGVGGKGICSGDSGGPLAVNGKLAGIVSWGVGCASPNFPGVFSNVFYLRPWILQKLAKINGH